MVLLLCLVTFDAPAQGLVSVPAGEAKLSPQEVLESLLFQSSCLNFQASQIRQIYKLMAGVVDCPVFPAAWDFVFPAVGHSTDEWTVALVRPGTEVPCAGFSVTPPKSNGGPPIVRMKQAPQLDEDALARLRMVRVARDEVDAALGEGRHMYALLPTPTPDCGLVYAWSESDQPLSGAKDIVRIAAAVAIYVEGGLGDYAANKVIIIHESGLAWDVSGVRGSPPLGIRSAQDAGDGFLTAIDLLRVRANPHLAPRLLRTREWTIVLNADGSSRKLEGRDLVKILKLDPGLLPQALPPSPELQRYKSVSPHIDRPGVPAAPNKPVGPSVPAPAIPEFKKAEPLLDLHAALGTSTGGGDVKVQGEVH
jgi:hypothetical protein